MMAVAVRWRKRLLGIGLGIGLLLFLRQMWVSYEAIREHDVLLIRPGFLLGGVGAALLMYLIQMAAWALLMQYLGVSISLRQALRGYFLSFLPRYIPGTVWGYWSRSEWLEQSFDVPYAVSAAGSVLEAVSLVLTGLFMGGLQLCTSATGPIRVAVALASIALLGLAWLIVPVLVEPIYKRFSREPLISSLALGRPRAAWSAAIALHLLFWLAFGLSLLLVTNSVTEVLSADLLASTFATSFSWIVGFIVVIVPAGLGVREITLSALLATFSGLPSHEANLIATISRFVIIVGELVWLLVGLTGSTGRWHRARELSRRPE